MDSEKIYQKIFYSTTKYLVLKNVFMFTAGILSIFIVRLLQPAEYGKWALVYQLVATLGPILSLGFLSTLAKFIPEYSDEKRKNELFSQVLLIVILAFLVFSLLYAAGTSLFPKILPQEIKIVRYPFLFFIGALAFVNLIEGYYRGLGKFNQWTVIDGSRSVLSAGLAILLFLTLSKSFETVFYTYFFTIILFLILLFGYLRKNLNLPPKANSDVLLRSNLTLNLNLEPKIIKFTLIMLAGQIVFLLGTTIDSVLLRALLKDPAQVGYYSAGIRIPQMLQTMLLAPLSVPFLYYFSNSATSQSRKKMLEFGTKMLGIICGLVSLFIFSFADKIVLMLFSKTYIESIKVLQIYSFVLFLLGLEILSSPFFMSINKPYLLVLLGFLAVLIISLLNFLFIPPLKSFGPPIATIVGHMFLTISIIFLLSKNGIQIGRNSSLLFISMLLSVIAGLNSKSFFSILFFLVFVFVTGLITFEDIRKTKILFQKQRRN